MEVAIRVNQREIVIPFYRVGVPEMKDGQLSEIWETFKDWGHRDMKRKES